MQPPDPIWLYRITHVSNLAHALEYGLVCSTSPVADPAFVRIGDSSLIDKRKTILAPPETGGTLAEYIPFYLGPRSPMLYQIATGWEDVPKQPQADIIYIITSVSALKAAGCTYFFTDGHARAQTSAKYTADADFAKLDWDAIYATKWVSDESDLRRKEKKQAELLVKDWVPPDCFQHLGVFSDAAGAVVERILAACGRSLPVRVSPEKLYYAHLQNR